MLLSRATANWVGGLSDRLMQRIPDFLLDPNPLSRDAYVSRLRFYADWDESRGFFSSPSTPPQAAVRESKPFRDGDRVLFAFPSGYIPHVEEMASELASHKNNQTAYLHLWRHAPEPGAVPRPLVLCVHGFGMSGPTRAEVMFKIDRLFDAGMDVALHTLPHHWRRATKRRRDQFLRPQDVPFTLEEWGRNIHDLHASVAWLGQLGYNRIGMIGASLGGLTAALYATMPNPLEFIFLVVPAVDLAVQMAPRPSRMHFPVDAEVAQLSARALQRIVPYRLPLMMDPKHVGIVAHQGDMICPIAHTRRLAAAWSIENFTEVVGGHWVYLDRSVRGRKWYGFLADHGFLA